jgi:serine/threonine protein kinase
MEFVPGDSLRQRLKDLRAKGQQWIGLPEAIQLIRQVCLAIHHAHRHGVLHRDLKPANIILKPEPAEGLPYRPVLTDFGLAKLLEGELKMEAGRLMAPLDYMSPGQLQGQKVDARSDLYSLVILLYESTVGQPPFPIQNILEAIHYSKCLSEK